MSGRRPGMKIPYGVYLNTLPGWEPLPEGYNITYQPTGEGHAYFAWNEHIEKSCRHFSRSIGSAFVAKEYATYQAAQQAIIEHAQGCTEAFHPDSEVNVIVMPPISF